MAQKQKKIKPKSTDRTIEIVKEPNLEELKNEISDILDEAREGISSAIRDTRIQKQSGQ